MSKKILILNGPNLNLLGTREPEIYGRETLADIEALCSNAAGRCGLSIEFKQSNNESDLVQWIQDARLSCSAIIINAAAYTHTSVAVADALKAVNLPTIEVHLSNIYQRESFRHHSYISPIAKGVICGLGSKGYVLAIEALSEVLS